MKKIELNINNQIYKNIYKAETFFERLKGLMFIKKEKAFILFLPNCNSIHTCFMKFSITIICLNEKMEAVEIIKDIKPFRLILPRKDVKHIIEIPNNMFNENFENITIQKQNIFQK